MSTLTTDQTTTLTELLGDFVSALADGRIDAEEASDLLLKLTELVPTENLFDTAGSWIEDLLYRDSEELLAVAARKREKAAEARAEGKVDKAERLEAKANELEAKADEREA